MTKVTESVFYVTKVHRVSILRDQDLQGVFCLTGKYRISILHDQDIQDLFYMTRMYKNSTKRDLKGRRFDTVEDVIAASTRALNSIQVEEFHRCFEQWKQIG